MTPSPSSVYSVPVGVTCPTARMSPYHASALSPVLSESVNAVIDLSALGSSPNTFL